MPFLFLALLLGSGSAAAPLNVEEAISAARAMMRFPVSGTAVTA
jgi:hypothetical protein